MNPNPRLGPMLRSLGASHRLQLSMSPRARVSLRTFQSLPDSEKFSGLNPLEISELRTLLRLREIKSLQSERLRGRLAP